MNQNLIRPNIGTEAPTINSDARRPPPSQHVLESTIRLTLSRCASTSLPEMIGGLQRIWEIHPATVHDALNNLMQSGYLSLTDQGRYQINV